MSTDKEYTKAFGERVRARRKAMGMTQEDLAAKVGFKSKQAISHVETRVRKPAQSASERMLKLAENAKKSAAGEDLLSPLLYRIL